MKFFPIKTDDNTLSLYNLDVEDVYHSKVGAYTESMQKYVIPSKILKFAQENQKIKILDFCYGLGYNSRTAVNEILKVNPEANIEITALDNDPYVVVFSGLIGCDRYEESVNTFFVQELCRQLDMQQVVEEYFLKCSEFEANIKNKIPSQYIPVDMDELRSVLHNIYYRTFSSDKSIDKNAYDIRLSVDFLVNDARISLKNLNKTYDFIFFDPFTPAKVPFLWTVEIFKLLHSLLNENGNLTTYSNAAPIRAGMIEAGFAIGQTTPVGKKTSGTIAYKKQEFVKTPLLEKEAELLKTTAGIPYRDEKFSASTEEILNKRELEQQSSGRKSSSSFLKSYVKRGAV